MTSISKFVHAARLGSHAPAESSRLFRDPTSQGVAFAVITALAYYGGTAMGFALTPHNSPISALWPPNAVLLAILLLVPRRRWWIPLLAVLPAHLLYQLRIGVPISTSLGWYLGNTGEAVLGALCLIAFAKPEKLFNSVRGIIGFLAFGVLLAPLASSFVDAAAVVFTGWGSDYWALWWQRLLSNALAELIFVPLIVTFYLESASWVRKTSLRNYLEVFLLAAGLALASTFLFNLEETSRYSAAFEYLPLAFLLWAAIRLGAAGLSTSLLMFSVIAIVGTLHGRGPFPLISGHADLFSLHILLCSVATPLMVLAAVVAERVGAQELLRQLARRLIATQGQEREGIARELHDDLGQRLAMVSIELEALGDDVDDTKKEQVRQLATNVAAASESSRELSNRLYPVRLHYLGLDSALRELCEQTAASSALIVGFTAERLGSPLTAEIESCLFRVAQEAVENAVLHSHPSRLTMQLLEKENVLRLRITHDCQSFEPSLSMRHAIGLAALRERVAAIGGRLQISSGPSQGTSIDAIIPLT
jgi:signal transduction histidine kinase